MQCCLCTHSQAGPMDGGGFGVQPSHNQGHWHRAPPGSRGVEDPKQLHWALSLGTRLALIPLG